MEKPPPKVFKVKDPDPDDKFSDIHPHLPQPPSLLLIVGSVKQGKSNLLVNLLCNPDMYKDKFDIVKIISNTLNADPKGKLMNKYFECEDHYTDEMVTDIIESQKKYEDFERPSIALVLDDILTKDFKKSNAVSFLATRFRHYVKPNSGDPCLVLYSTQRYFDLSRIVRNNATGLLFSGNIKSRKEWESIMDDYADTFGGRQRFEEMIKEVQAEPYTWLYLRLDTKPPQALKNFQEQLFP